MKSNVFKSSLAAFAFTLAIVASFAFSPAFSDVTVALGYEQFQPSAVHPDDCIARKLCQVEGTPIICTIILDNVLTPLYDLEGNPPSCTKVLYEIDF